MPGAASFSLGELYYRGYLAAGRRVDSGSVHRPGYLRPGAGAGLGGPGPAFAPARLLLVSLQRPKPRGKGSFAPHPPRQEGCPSYPGCGGFSRAPCLRAYTWKKRFQQTGETHPELPTRLPWPFMSELHSDCPILPCPPVRGQSTCGCPFSTCGDYLLFQKIVVFFV